MSRTGRAGMLKASNRTFAIHRFFDGDGDGDGDGGGLSLDDPKVKEFVDNAVAEATKGLTGKRDELLSEKKDLQKRLGEMQKQWEGLDPEVVKNLVNRMQNDEETKLIAEGKVDEVIQRRVGAMQKDYDTKLDAAQKRTSELEESLQSKDSKIKELIIDGSIRQAAAKLNLHPSAYEDAIFRAKGQFDLDDDGNLVARDDQGALLMGRNGKDPLSVDEWLDAMKEKAPHWFPAPSGAGASGSGGGRGGNFTISRSEARDPQKYQAAKAAAEKAGQPLQIVEG